MGSLPFSIPPNVHLLITTPSRVLTWDAQGLGIVFKSSKRGIVAAREAGNGILAVADQHTVVLHDSKRVSARGVERSWGLNADEDHVRHLAYSQSARRLFLSTALTGDVLDYSPEQTTRVKPAIQVHHESSPTAMAVSPTGQWMVSASDDPPAVYLKRLNVPEPPVLIQPAASEAAPHVAAFHPERPNVFLLAFRDGTVAAYDVTKVVQQDGVAVRDGEIAHLYDLHRPTSKIVSKDGIGVKQTSVTAAALLPGYRTRAISVGSDGRCKLFDFAGNGFVLRTWHAKGPLTSVSVMSIRHPSHERAIDSINALRRKRAGIRQDRVRMGGPTSTDNLIAVGRLDGKVQIYDSVGLLLMQKIVSDNAERVIALEWLNGPSPGRLMEETSKIVEVLGREEEVAPAPRCRQTTIDAKNAKGKPELARKSSSPLNDVSAVPMRRFTIHPDEVAELGTVIRSPQKTQGFEAATRYPDLFSADVPGRLVSKSRPRLSSKTFIKAVNAPGRVVESRAETEQQRRRGTHVSPLESGETRVEAVPRRNANNSASIELAKIHDNAERSEHGTGLQTVVIGGRRVRPNERADVVRKTHRHMHPSLKAPATQQNWDPGNVLERESTWPTDSMQDQSLHTDGEDIWVTSESETETAVEGPHAADRILGDTGLNQIQRPQEESRLYAPTRPSGAGPGRESRFTERVENGIAMSTKLPIPRVGGSTDEEMFSAGTHLSPDGAFSPSSDHVRDLFPRRSSLSWTAKKEKRKSRRSIIGRPSQCQAIEPLASRQPYRAKDPWARLQLERDDILRGEHGWDETIDAEFEGRRVTSPCTGCAEKDIQLQRLIEDREKMRAQVMILGRLCQETIPLTSTRHSGGP